MDQIIFFGLLNVPMYFCAVFHPLSVWSVASSPPPLLVQSLLDKVLQRRMHSTEPLFSFILVNFTKASVIISNSGAIKSPLYKCACIVLFLGKGLQTMIYLCV